MESRKVKGKEFGGLSTEGRRIDYMALMDTSCAGRCDNLTCGNNNTTLHGERRGELMWDGATDPWVVQAR